MKKHRRWVTFLLVLCLVLQMVPAVVHAAEPEAEVVTIGSSITPTPEIPQAAQSIPGVTSTEILLNDTTGSGKWKFLYDVPDYTTSGMPAPTAANQDFDFTQWIDKNWQNIKVPGEAAMQGFDIKSNNEYYYQTTVTVPADFEGQRVLLRFDGVYCNARVWVNGEHVKTHVGGFTTWDVDLTDLVQPGQSATVTLGVASIYASTVGIWNPTGVSVNNPANADEYAHHNIGGILRDVSLVAMPKTGIARTYINTDFDESFVNATLELTAQLTMADASAKLTAEILDGETLVASGSMDFTKKDGETLSDAKKISIPVTAPKQWDAEHPNLYTLRTTLTVGGVTKQVNEEKFGFREISYSAKDGTAANKIFVNGKEVKLRGTCRHDVSDDLGRSMTEEECWEEIRAYKKANINFIRTSHYPVSEYTLDACDALGIYVEQETALCFQGSWGPVVSKYEDYLPQFAEMIERDRNRASILMWSLGNESNFKNIENQSGGDAIGDEWRYVKAVEPTRPVIFSYPGTGEHDVKYDIYSQHYASVTGGLGSSTIPVLHDEYAHVPCYNLDELQRDTNVRNAWGESLKIGWENIFTTDGALGGAIWGGIDDVFYVPDNITQFWQSHSSGQTTGYGEWGSVLDVYLREKPEAYLTKKAYSPVRLDEENAIFTNGTLKIPVKNWFDHTNLNELTVRYTIGDQTTTVPVTQNIEPHKSGMFVLPLDVEKLSRIRLEFLDSTGLVIDTFDVKLGEDSYLFAPLGDIPPTVTETDDSLTVVGKDFSVEFSKASGLIISAKYGNETLITGGPYLHLTGATTGDWTLTDMTHETVENQVKVTLNGQYDQGLAVQFVIAISDGGVIDTAYTVTDGSASGLSELGVRYDIPQDVYSVDWLREGLYSYYPEDAIGRNQGTAYKVRPGSDEKPDQYGVMPQWPWKDDMKNYFVYPTEDRNNGIQTNDFKALRENIRYYNVNFSAEENAPHISVETSDAENAARVALSYNLGYIDDTDSRIRYVGGWGTYGASGDYNGTEHYSTALNAYCEIDFYGTGIRFIGSKQNNVGKVDVYLDGELQQTVDTYSDLGNQLKQSTIYDVNNLEVGNHTLKLVTAGGHANCFVVDAFEIYGGPDGGRIDSALVIDNFWSYPSMGWGNFSRGQKSISAESTGDARIRLTDVNSYTEAAVETLVGLNVKQEGNVLTAEYTVQNETEQTTVEIEWFRYKVGDAASKAEKAGTGKSLTMTESVGWNYYFSAKMTRADGAAVRKSSQAVVPNDHLVAYYDVTEDGEEFTYTGTQGKDYWTDANKSWTANAYNKTVTYLIDTDTESSVTFTFTGKTFRWVGGKENNQGIASVYMDDANEPVKVDLYGEASTGSQVNEVLFEQVFETEGRHTVKIVRSEEKNPESKGANISLDVFIVLSEALPPEKLTGLEITESDSTLTAGYTIENETAATGPVDIQWFRYKVGDPVSKAVKVSDGKTLTLVAGEDVGYSYYFAATLTRADGQTVTVTSDAVMPNEELVHYHDVTVDGEGFVYTGTAGTDYKTDADKFWTANAYNKTVTYLLDTGNESSVTFTFTGKTFRWVGGKESNQGIASVYLDGAAEPVKVDLYGTAGTGTQVNEILFEKVFNTTGEHTVKIIRTGEKNEESLAANISLDVFIVLDEAAATEPTSAQKVDALIMQIGEVTLDSKPAIDAARAAYEALTEEEKAQVTKLDVLEAAEARYNELVKAQEDAQAATAVDELIDQIGEVTLDSKSAIDAARAAYEALTENQKALVTKLEVLEAAETRYAELVKTEEDEQAATAVDALIDQIGEVALDSKSAIDAARAAYEALTDVQKALVTKLEVLEAAEARYAELTKQPEEPEEPVPPVFPPVHKPVNKDDGQNVEKFPFADVNPTAWYYDSVKAAWEKGLIDGMTETQFEPDSTLTVAQAIKLAAALEQLYREGSVTLTNGSAQWYDSYVDYAVEQGVIEEDYRACTKARMNAPITREEFVHILHGALHNAPAVNQVAENAIPDVKSGGKFAAEIYEFYRAGITNGSDEQGTFRPTSSIKRSEVAAILIRMFDPSVRVSIALN